MGNINYAELKEHLEKAEKSIAKSKEKHSKEPAFMQAPALEILDKAVVSLKKAKTLLQLGETKEAAEAALPLFNILATLDLRCIIACYRKTDKMRKKQLPVNNVTSIAGYRDLNDLNTFLDEAEKKLDDWEFDEANKIMDEYFKNKIAAGHIGPVA